MEKGTGIGGMWEGGEEKEIKKRIARKKMEIELLQMGREVRDEKSTEG